ncbi:glutamate ligase domain-containing protein [Kitasatospora sp. NPDC088556]|uniref:glutamate ligase domain-containing protein n=1 Tax=Kitasatospora sp. NPDC088556 TaxID=3364076 RepID=UPI0038042E82
METVDTTAPTRANGDGQPAPVAPDVLDRAHLVDVTKPGMEGLALWLATRGLNVTGSISLADRDSAAAARLREAGVDVAVSFDARAVRGDRTCVVWPGAAADGARSDLDRARELGLPVLERGQAMALLSAGFGRPLVAVGGSHGTTTAAAVLAATLADGRTGWILNAASQNGAPGHGGDRRLVVDLCPDTSTQEAASARSWSWHPSAATPYARPQPTVTLITAVARNEPHYTDTTEALNAATNLARSSAAVVLPMWETGCRIVHERLTDRPGPRVVTVGTDPAYTVWIKFLSWTGFDFRVVLRYEERDCGFVLPVTGRHHALAVCAALATALVLGETRKNLIERASEFHGVERSLAELGTQGGVTVFDSRARHPAEVAEDIQAARMLTEGNVIVALEPDGIARTSAHAAELGAALGDADHVLLLPVSIPLDHHAAPDPLDAVERAAVRVLGDGAVHRVRSGPCQPCPEQRIVEMATEGDLVLVVGTGQAERLGPRVLDRLTPTGAPGADRP